MAGWVRQAQSSFPRLTALSLGVVALAYSAPAFAETTVDADAKPLLVGGGAFATLLLLALGGALLRAGWRRSRLGEATRDWPSASGRVISAEVVTKKGYNDGEYNYYSPEIRYAYEVNGQSYVGQTIKFGLADVQFPGEEPAREWLTRYPVGADPEVRYDPAKPGDSALELGQLNGGRWIISGSILLLAALAPLWFTISTALEPVK